MQAKPNHLNAYAWQLTTMQAKGKSISDMLLWLRCNPGIIANPAQLERFLKQKESAAAPSSMPCQSPPCRAKALATAESASGGIATTAELEYQQLMNPVPSPVSQPTTLDNKLTLDTLMDRFKQVLFRVMDKSDDQPNTLKVIDKMMHTVIGYEQGKERLEQSNRKLKIKEDNRDLKVRKAAADQAARQEAPRKEAPQLTPQRASGRCRSSVLPEDQTETTPPPPPPQPAELPAGLAPL